MEIHIIKPTTKLTLSFWVIYEEKNGEFRRIFMEMEAQILEEKKDMVFGSILVKIFISIAFFGLQLALCKFLL